MSEARALRDKLEETQGELRRTRAHLEKLRAHQTREQESLREQLEGARREVAELRLRLQVLEESGHEARAKVAPVLVEPVLMSSSSGSSTALIALVREPPSLEEAIPTLSRLLRVAPADMRIRLMGAPPTVVARVPLAEVAALREALRGEGFLSVGREVLPRLAGGMTVVRRFTLGERVMELTGTQGERQQVLYTELRLLVRGRRVTIEVGDRPVWDSDADLAVLGGVKPESRREQYDQFLWIYGEGVQAAFTHATAFAGLGEQMGLTRYDSLNRLTEELRQRAAQVVFDERFMRAPGFSLPLVEEGRGQELVAELLDQAIQEGLWS